MNKHEELKKLSRNEITIKGVTDCGLKIRYRAKHDRKNGTQASNKHIKSIFDAYNEFVEAEIGNLICITSDERTKKKPKAISSNPFEIHKNSSKEEIRNAIIIQENTAKRQNEFNSKSKEFIDAQAFINDAIGVVITRINRAKAMVEKYWDRYLRFLKDDAIELPRFEDNDETMNKIINLLNIGGNDNEAI